MIVSGFPNLSVIKAMRGHVDFYMLNGQAIARRWPRIRMGTPTAAQLWGRKVPSIGNDLRSRLPVYWWNAWNSMATPVGRTSWDTFTNVFYWLAHHHYMFDPIPPFIDVLNVPMMPMAMELTPIGPTTRVYLYIIMESPYTIERSLFNYAPATDETAANFAYVYTAGYAGAPSNTPPPYSWAWPTTIDPIFQTMNPFLWRIEAILPGNFDRIICWESFRFLPGESPIRQNPPNGPVWYSDFLPDTPAPGWPPIYAKWPWMPWWPPYYTAL